VLAQPIRGYIVIGYNLRYLLDVSTNHSVYGKKRVLDTIRTLIRDCTDSGLLVTSRTALDLYDPLITTWDKGKRHADLHTRTLSLEEVAAVKEASYQVQTVAFSEAQGVFAHVTRDKRFPVDRLLSDVPSLMSPGIFEALPEVARYDFGEAGRCIAFEAPTAAAFHLMRATEDVLRYFYCSLVERDRVRLMWGDIVAGLRKLGSPPPAVLLNNLDNLRTGFRNPTQHPEMIYDIEDAQDLFALSVDAVNRMMKYLGDMNKPNARQTE
jgi:hypothetical protein